MDDSSKGKPSLPSWQQSEPARDSDAPAKFPHASDSTTRSSYAELLDEAREFLKNESVQKKASRERKIAFLKDKGLHGDDIEKLLNEQANNISEGRTEELKIVHDSNTINNDSASRTATTTSSEADTTTTPPKSQEKPSQPQQPQRDVPPIITYPEFLLKPQKPPPLITVPRLINAAYAFGGLASLTYATSKYIVEPMLETLTEARHSLATTAIEDLETLNKKLESSVSHVPYIASAAARKSTDQDRNAGAGHDDDNDNDSIVSDPTELFHHDIATQTTPSLSRTQSIDSQNQHLDPTTQQVMRLSSLHDTLTSLAVALDPKDVPYLPAPASKKLHETLSDFQNVLDRLETVYNPLRGEYYSSIYMQPGSAEGKSKGSSSSGGKDNDVAAKVRSEIRALKGAFLSARNFPTPSRPTTNSYVSR